MPGPAGSEERTLETGGVTSGLKDISANRGADGFQAPSLDSYTGDRRYPARLIDATGEILERRARHGSASLVEDVS
jgi:hypothetical protein